jgi:hypothetical protein
MKYTTSVKDGITVRHPEDVAVADPFVDIDYRVVEVNGVPIPRHALSLVDPIDKHLHFVQAHTDSYEPITNAAAMALATQVLERTEVGFQPADILWDGKRFNARFVSDRLVQDAVPGDTLALGLLVQNSYDGTMSFGIRFFVQRLVCMNGMFFTQTLGGFTLKHLNGNTDQYDEAAQRILGGAAKFPGLVTQIGRLAQRPATLQTVSNWALELDKGTPKFPRSNLLDILSDLRDADSPSLWDQLNAFTYVANHEVAPFTGMDLSDRICRVALAELN